MHRQRTFHRSYQYPSQDTPLVSLGVPNSVGGDRWGWSVGIRVFAVVRGKSARVAQSSFKPKLHVAAGRRAVCGLALRWEEGVGTGTKNELDPGASRHDPHLPSSLFSSSPAPSPSPFIATLRVTTFVGQSTAQIFFHTRPNELLTMTTA